MPIMALAGRCVTTGFMISIAALLCAPLWGWLLDRRGAYPVILGACFLCAISVLRIAGKSCYPIWHALATLVLNIPEGLLLDRLSMGVCTVFCAYGTVALLVFGQSCGHCSCGGGTIAFKVRGAVAFALLAVFDRCRAWVICNENVVGHRIWQPRRMGVMLCGASAGVLLLATPNPGPLARIVTILATTAASASLMAVEPLIKTCASDLSTDNTQGTSFGVLALLAGAGEALGSIAFAHMYASGSTIDGHEQTLSSFRLLALVSLSVGIGLYLATDYAGARVTASVPAAPSSLPRTPRSLDDKLH
ncbi:uncharacterized protein MONBRDRAFT_5736 [Monosiga brevicollis MX1]|uniref:Uncharacterized protein n=1 Tax=Monosiga brevicollis TaxID=81824 RepID=A9USB0_MONBE|nr:uncharacterized protein MONBRDRAFT_5736 [Monosiga brevicollis MX1]EDQ92069.1 predicted protein [Monosiga brevicollis MX1]|eukprot:XP_001743355.1 hypothetical protein [Monosiga brevicollis MX1]